MSRSGLIGSVAGGALLLSVALAAAGGPAAGSIRSDARSHIGALDVPSSPLTKLVQLGAGAPTYAQCEAAFQIPCYGPEQIRHAYGVDDLINRGDGGAGQSIVIFDSYGSPTITSDLAQFDSDYGLPAPPSFKILSPLGTVPFNPSQIPDQIGWAAETTLDVEYAHAMAPSASIVLMTSPVDETQGVQGMPQFNQLENYALHHHLGHVWSQSWATTENTLFTTAGQQVYQQFESTYARAADHHVTVLASAGDSGTANPDVNGNIYPFPTVNFPSSSPLVTSVGGTSLYADANGNYQSETVWNDGPGSATGGGISQKFAEPFYQRLLPSSDQTLLNGHRGLPDISWNADPNTPVLVYLSFLGASNAGYYLIGGTSEGSPSLAGMVADLDTLAHHPVGFLNPYLYALGAAGVGFHDITVGNNSQLTNTPPIPGYSATPGWDAATGWGTPDLGQLFGDIALLSRGNPSLGTIEARARAFRK